MLKNIVFDFGNVVMKYDPDAILNQYDLSKENHELLKKIIFDSPEWLKVDAGELTEDEATDIFVKRVPKGLSEKVREIMSSWPAKAIYFKEVFDWMEELKKQGYHIYALSNTGMRFANYLINSKYGKNFDGTIFSAEEKLMKPDSEIYQRLLKKYNLKADECLFIDDRPENTATAEQLGMQVFTFQIDKLPQLKKYVKELK